MFRIEDLLRTAGESGASDVHITAGLPPMLRVNGKLQSAPFPRLQPSDTLELLICIMNQEQMESFEEAGEADLSFSIEGLGRYRVNAFRQKGMAALTFRLMDTKVPCPEELNLPGSVTGLGLKQKGLVLVTGPAGCGKSTTMAAVIDYINTVRMAHIITLESPVEYVHAHKKSIVNQREIGRDTASFVTGLNAALREDPDVIFIGEIREGEVLELALAAAQTGHLVFASMYSWDTVSAIDHLIDMAAPHRRTHVCFELAGALEATVAQKLVPTLDGLKRIAVFEVMNVDAKIRDLIRTGETRGIPVLMQERTRDGVTTMDESVLKLYRDGVISWEEALLAADNPDEMERRKNG